MTQKPPSKNASSAEFQRDRQALQEALRHHQSGDLVRAEIGYRNVLQSQKNNFDALHMLAVVGYQTNQMAGSLELFERAKDVGPTTCEFFVNYGAALRKAKRLPEAISAYDAALKLQPDKYEAIVNKAESCLDLKEYESAATLYERASDNHKAR